MLESRPALAPAPRSTGTRVLVGALFAVYLVLLVWLVMWKLHDPFVGRPEMRSLKLVPFVASDGFGSSAIREVVGNVLVFVPLGAYLGALAPRSSVARVTLVASVVSVGFETAQYVTAVGSSDITDVITNTLGALLGVVAIRMLRRVAPPGARTGLLVAALLATCAAVLAVAVVVAGRPQPTPGEGATLPATSQAT